MTDKGNVRYSIRTVLAVMVTAVMVIGTGCSGSDSASTETPSGAVEHGCALADTLPESVPSDFNLLFQYGYGTAARRNTLNTFNGTYLKDLGSDPPVTIDFRLTDEDMERIYQKMMEIDFFCYPDTFVMPVPEDGIVTAETPYQGYYFKVVCDGTVKVLRWEDNIVALSSDATELRKLIRLIRRLIESSDEYKSLPEDKGLLV